MYMSKNGLIQILGPVWYYAFQYPLDFHADVTQDSCLTAAYFRSIAAYFDQEPSTKTSN